MTRRLNAVTTTTVIDHHLFELVDPDHAGEGLPVPHKAGTWVSAGRSSILVESPYDNVDAILRLEEWDAEPEPPGAWDDVVTVTVENFTGAIGVDQITAGPHDPGFSLTRPGRFHARLACRNGGAAQQAYLDVLARFGDTSSRACGQALDEIGVKEEYLVQFWPAA